MKEMKNIFAILCCLFISQSVMAQLTSVKLNTDGRKVRFGVVVDALGEVVIDNYGNVLRVVYRDGCGDGDVRCEYYSNFHKYEAGKIKSLGGIKFTYYSDFNNYEAGKIKTIAGVDVKYYSSFNDYEAGKIKSIGGVKVGYYSNFNNYEAGKIKTIGSHKYEYFSDFGNDYNAGLLKSGAVKVNVNGINFMVVGR